MNAEETKYRIKEKLKRFGQGRLLDNALELFRVLGYDSDKRLELFPNTPDHFLETFESYQALNKQRAFFDEWKTIDLLFQLTGEEISEQSRLFNTNQIDNTIMESYLFFAMELKGDQYARGKLAQITREINKHSAAPIMVLFKHGGTLTLSIINRRLHKRDSSRDVLEKVTLIKDIAVADPHRAHIEILFDLSLDQLQQRHGVTNFVELHNAWQKTLDTSELNKRFYREIANWYFWAMDQVTFPSQNPESDVRVRNATGVIRLITRLIFVWFMKEKKLIPESLFDQKTLKTILKYEDKNDSTYYKAILQNLFFATLNQEMGEREFRKRTSQKRGRDQHYMVPFLYRYKRYFKNPDQALKLFEDIPFLNGGLFECLDRLDPEDSKKILRIDGFSDREDNELRIPDDLFFSPERAIDLDEVYGTRGKRYKVRGIIGILNRYKFTVAENTPIEEEIALDPELLGKVFENLLASYNPETQTTARKQTGSFYTPREIVNYMVDESLIAYLESRLTAPREEQTEFVQRTPPGQERLFGKPEPVQTELSPSAKTVSDEERKEIHDKLRHLFEYSDVPHEFSEEEVEVLIDAIDHVKILDPACGSAAFPMGILHKLVFILDKLDSDNEKWKDKQIGKVQNTIKSAEQIDDVNVRETTIKELEARIEDIEQAFENNALDYGRKLYLIENCIYGVDIQTIAVEISKLRCFISLLIDENVDDSRPNRGVRALPNLETKFVAANTLIGIEKPQQGILLNPEIIRKEDELHRVRERLFTAKAPQTKRKYREQDKQIRNEISVLLKKDGFPREITERLAQWDPYDPTYSADFFDMEWMFGIREGFDIAIANPPYIRQESIRHLKPVLEKERYEVYNSTSDLYTYFYEKSYNILKNNGICTFITSNKWMRAKYGGKLRRFLKEKAVLQQLIDFGGFQVFEATVDTNILIFQKLSGRATAEHKVNITLIEEDYQAEESINSYVQSKTFEILQKALNEKAFAFADENTLGIKQKIEEAGTSLKDCNINIYRGIITGFNKAFIIDNSTKERLCEEDSKSIEVIKPILRGRDIDKTYYIWAELWMIIIPSGWTNKNRGRKSPEAFFKETYPAIYNYLEEIGDRIERGEIKAKGKGLYGRDDQGDYWWELRPCDYYSEFEKQKIVYPDINYRLTFCLDEKKRYLSNTAYFLRIREDSRYTLALLNSSLLDWYYQFITSQLGAKGIRHFSIYIEQLPILELSKSDQQPFVTLVDQILARTQSDDYLQDPKRQAEVQDLERQIDEKVYRLYGLTDEEIAIVEGKKP